ncbi:multidrug resistance protein (hlyD family), emrA-like secretion [Cupriavidus basilensis OR16]|uniref:Multidrug resistance protein (HlyD family), emrA-like secretion n=1 Tax=Cupriavidus basilensis OR16 TaxID=1127483 RepID=H1S3A1_9BURK|nr:HlyD family secretion protein [Cupriavidus basilensis]EHP43006.1 multidrug resistance protein (hlyD family), emrA-like secretion [Cupriavidus basilensis OR16]
MSTAAPVDSPADPLLRGEATSTPVKPAVRNRRRTVLLFLAGGVLVGAAAWGGHWWTVGRFMETTDDAYLQADSVTVAPKVGGYIAEVLVRDNQTVVIGQALARLDSRQYQAALDEATATVASRQADVARSEADLAQQQANIAQAKAELDGARANVRYAASQVDRYAPLVKSGAETEERTAELRNAQTRAATTQQANEAALRAAQSQTLTLQAKLQQARAQLAVAEASARRAQLDMQDTLVRSTLAGRVADRAVRVGQFAQPGTRLLTIVPLQDLYLNANFKETQVGHMIPGQPVTIHVDALPDADLHGTVESLSPGTGSQFALLPAQNATGNFTKIVQRVPVRIHLDVSGEARRALVPGLSVTVEVDTRHAASTQAQAPAGGARG